MQTRTVSLREIIIPIERQEHTQFENNNDQMWQDDDIYTPPKKRTTYTLLFVTIFILSMLPTIIIAHDKSILSNIATKEKGETKDYKEIVKKELQLTERDTNDTILMKNKINGYLDNYKSQSNKNFAKPNLVFLASNKSKIDNSFYAFSTPDDTVFIINNKEKLNQNDLYSIMMQISYVINNDSKELFYQSVANELNSDNINKNEIYRKALQNNIDNNYNTYQQRNAVEFSKQATMKIISQK